MQAKGYPLCHMPLPRIYCNLCPVSPLRHRLQPGRRTPSQRLSSLPEERKRQRNSSPGRHRRKRALHATKARRHAPVRISMLGYSPRLIMASAGDVDTVYLEATNTQIDEARVG